MPKQNLPRRYRLLFAALLGFTMPGMAHAGDLVIDIHKIRSDRGKIMLGISDSPDSFKARSWLVAFALPAKAGSLRVTVPELAAGTYAVSIHHDENGDGKMDTNAQGVPTEGYGFSNNARGDFGPPSFSAAAFTLPLAAPGLTIDLGY